MAASSTLSGGITASALTFTVANGSAFPVSGFLVQIDSELILVSRRSGNVFTVDGQRDARGRNGTTAASHLNGATVSEITQTAEMALRAKDGVLRTYDRRRSHAEQRKVFV